MCSAAPGTHLAMTPVSTSRAGLWSTMSAMRESTVNSRATCWSTSNGSVHSWVPADTSSVRPEGSTTSAVTPTGTVAKIRAWPSASTHPASAVPYGVSSLADAEVSPRRGGCGATRMRRYPGAAAARPATTRCIQSATAPKA